MTRNHRTWSGRARLRRLDIYTSHTIALRTMSTNIYTLRTLYLHYLHSARCGEEELLFYNFCRVTPHRGLVSSLDQGAPASRILQRVANIYTYLLTLSTFIYSTLPRWSELCRVVAIYLNNMKLMKMVNVAIYIHVFQEVF